MHIGLVLPHLGVAGGPKVVLRIAEQLAAMQVEVTVLVNRLHDKKISWLFPGGPKFKVISAPEISYHTVPDDIDILVDFGDGKPFAPLNPKMLHVLFLQGFGTQDYARECVNLSYPFDGVITTSSWISNLATKFGHTKVYTIPPGIDKVFSPKNVEKDHFVVGGLYHPAPKKNFSLFVASALKTYNAINKDIKYLALAARLPDDLSAFKAFGQIPYSLCVDPPQNLLPHIFSSLSVWLSTSLNEGFGLPVLENAACGVPIIYVPSFGLDEYMKHQSTCLIARDKNEIASHLNALYNDETLRNKLIKNGLNLAKNFTWKNSATKFLKALMAIRK